MTKRIQTKDKLAIISLVGMVLTFPASNRYVLDFIEWIYKYVVMYGGWVFLGLAIYLMGYIFSKVFAVEPVNIPKKTKKAPKVAYIET